MQKTSKELRKASNPAAEDCRDSQPYCRVRQGQPVASALGLRGAEVDEAAVQLMHYKFA